MKNSHFPCLALSVCLMISLIGCAIGDLVETVVEVPFTIVEAAIEVPVSVVDAVTDIPEHLKYELGEEQEWTLDSQDVSQIIAETKNGAIQVVSIDGNQILVKSRVRIHAKSRSAAEEFAQRVHVETYRSGNEVRVTCEHPRSSNRVNYSVHYEIQAPSVMNLHLKTSNGKIKIADIDGNVDAYTTNGRIELDRICGSVHAESTNGSIRADVEHIDGELSLTSTNGSMEAFIHDGIAPIRMETTNGSIRLHLPDNYSGNLNARTTNGGIHSEFPVTVYEARRNRMVGRMNNGEFPEIHLQSTNGSIYLKTLSNTATVANRE